MKIFRIDDCDWWIGEDAETVLAAVKDEYGYTGDDLGDFRELSADDLDRLKFHDTDEDEHTVGGPRTFREQLAIEVAEGGNFPRLFATTEF